MENNNIPARVLSKMLDNDRFSEWLGIEVIGISLGFCELKMVVRSEMLNGFGIAHGGIAFSLADSALAFASNSRNNKSVALEVSISFTAPVKEGDILTAKAEEMSVSRRIAIYLITVQKSDGTKVAVFKGTAFRKEECWFGDSE